MAGLQFLLVVKKEKHEPYQHRFKSAISARKYYMDNWTSKERLNSVAYVMNGDLRLYQSISGSRVMKYVGGSINPRPLQPLRQGQ